MTQKLNVILDLDQTLISAEELSSFDFKKYKKKIQLFNAKMMDDSYIVFARPHLDAFLDYLFENFNVSIWTAATKSYALFIINNFIKTKPNRKIDFIFFSYHCDYSMKCKKGLKNLSILWDNFGLKGYNKDNTVIIDDNDKVKRLQVCNCYAIPPFEFTDKDSEEDTELLSLIGKLEALRNYFVENPKPHECLSDLM